MKIGDRVKRKPMREMNATALARRGVIVEAYTPPDGKHQRMWRVRWDDDAPDDRAYPYLPIELVIV